jgi:phosphoribosyl-ATP pyrophosphohydrolase
MDHAQILARLEAVIAERLRGDPVASYVARLQAKGLGAIAQKVGEEATETVIAALTGDDAALTGEAADLLFHLMVLLRARGLSLDAVLAELERREGTSGIVEKARRS